MDQPIFAVHQKPDMSRGEFVAPAPTGSDANLWVEFYTAPSPTPNAAKSDEVGHPVYEDVPWIKILVPGDRTKAYDRPAKLELDGPNDQVPPDHRRFPQQWQAYTQQTTKATVGLPVEEWSAITRSEAQMFKRMDIHTVEQLAGLPDTALSWLGARVHREKASAWLQSAKDHAGESRLARENEQLRAQLVVLQDQVRELAARVGESPADPIGDAIKRGPGRPPKERNV
jgi:hypothetical protein